MSGGDTFLLVIDYIIFFLKWFWWLILIGWVIIMKMRMKNWPMEAVIIEKRGENLIKTNDRAGRYVDPYTGVTGYKLQKSKDTIPIIGYDWVLHNVTVNNTLLERFINLLRGNAGTIFLFRYGSRQYKPVKVNINGKSEIKYQEIKNDKGESVFIQVYQPFDPRDKLGALDFEVVDWDNMNFMVQEQRASIMRRQKSGDWIKNLAIPLVIIGASALVSLLMIKFGFDYATNMMNQKPTQTEAPQPATPPKVPIIGNLVTPG
jgi:hypothetical protein